MRIVHIGSGNLVNADRLLAVVSPDSAPIKRLIQQNREKGMLIDATYGRKTGSVMITDSGHVILSYLGTERIAQRIPEAELSLSEADGIE
ncbi:MAG: DUF370 domain-containing protein [Clostridia bacterium]|nr:DUF370 domain-containing protein [Clostridia bacterium]